MCASSEAHIETPEPALRRQGSLKGSIRDLKGLGFRVQEFKVLGV